MTAMLMIFIQEMYKNQERTFVNIPVLMKEIKYTWKIIISRKWILIIAILHLNASLIVDYSIKIYFLSLTLVGILCLSNN